jgi:transcriptional regulator with XRE-family HTH domain
MKLKVINIGLRIEQRLNELGMSKAEFGRLIGIQQQNVNRILSKTSIDTDKLIEISEALDYNFFGDFGARDINAENGSIAAGDNSHIHDNTTNGASPSLDKLAGSLSEAISQNSKLINIIDKLTSK